MVSNEALGYIGAAVAIIFFGSNYVVTKKFPMGDGVAFAWLMSCGILIIGFCTIPVAGERFTFVPTGLIGGMLWAFGNLATVPILKLVGLGVGFLCWSGTSLIGGYLVGKLGLFGVEREIITSPSKQAMNISGICMGVISLLLTFFIKPNVQQDVKNSEQEQQQQDDETQALIQNDDDAASKQTSSNMIKISMPTHLAEQQQQVPKKSYSTDVLYQSESDIDAQSSLQYQQSGLGARTERKSFLDEEEREYIINASATSTLQQTGDAAKRLKAAPSNQNGNGILARIQQVLNNDYVKRPLGIALGIFAGSMYAVNLVPFKLWQQQQEALKREMGPFDFVFSFISGIWLTTTAIFLIYCMLKRNNPEIYPNMIVSSIICGILWAVACCGWFCAAAYLGMTVGFPMTSIGPSVVTAFWTVIVFREISGLRNLLVLGASLAIGIGGVVLLALSH